MQIWAASALCTKLRNCEDGLIAELPPLNFFVIRIFAYPPPTPLWKRENLNGDFTYLIGDHAATRFIGWA